MEISILVMTYNHEEYIRQALNSILEQQISVSYEILILDDASTDATPRILKEYKRKYPQKIALFLRKRNSCHITKNDYFLMSKAKGKYVAFLEGDDYWIDILKLQKQYEFLEKNRKYSACVTDVMVVDGKGNEIPGMIFYEKKVNQIYTVQDFRDIKTAGMAGSLVMRNYFDSQDWSVIYRTSSMMGDITAFMLCVLKGPIYQMNEKTAAYRYVTVAGENNFNSIHKGNIYKDYMIVEYWIRLENYMKVHYKKDFEIVRIQEAIMGFSSRYTTEAMLHLIMQSKNWRKYLTIYIAHKYLLNSEFCLKGHDVLQVGYLNQWERYKRDRRQVVLFGAGGVAREYIDKYAWQGNILFLVDNDVKKQNRSFRGFLVKEPEEILKYKNIKVLITNKNHEEEIGYQLKGMGIKKYYCYCSMQASRLTNRVACGMLRKYGDGVNEGNWFAV